MIDYQCLRFCFYILMTKNTTWKSKTYKSKHNKTNRIIYISSNRPTKLIAKVVKT